MEDGILGKGQEMSQRHLDCSSEEVRAILEGRKTQTRQVIKLTEFQPCKMSGGSEWIFRDKHGCWNDVSTERLLEKYCPYKIGMQLWVREKFKIGQGRSIVYFDTFSRWAEDIPFKPSIHMPRWASRILLEIVSVRVQRVQEISYEDIIDEGISGHFLAYADAVKIALKDLASSQARIAYQKLWDSLNAKRGYSWQSNPGVWALGLKVVTK